jgi:hypothetical protein
MRLGLKKKFTCVIKNKCCEQEFETYPETLLAMPAHYFNSSGYRTYWQDSMYSNFHNVIVCSVLGSQYEKDGNLLPVCLLQYLDCSLYTVSVLLPSAVS